jgi:hypothetical protein
MQRIMIGMVGLISGPVVEPDGYPHFDRQNARSR